MKESVDFIKVKDYADININNMIPVPDDQYLLVDVNGTKDPHYKYCYRQKVEKSIDRRTGL
ncbi:MAG: type III toxin-antitoxin system ToxN/AbiQ family toxin [Eubacterium sp.]|nr:type III toxin-antitoxin system ToxN/AbiQ family toxin [Eubacterium sp.]